jgi:hypothetical protein
MAENKRFYIQGIGIADRERKRLYDLKTIDGFISIRDLLNELDTQLKPIQDICTKYKIPITDLPEVLEEYITLDNEEYEEKLKK